jgi:hypothetical protein
MDGLLDRRRQMVEGLLGLFSQPPVDPSPGANPLFADVFAGYQPPQKDVIGNISSGLARAFSPAEWQRQAQSLGQWPDPRSVMSKGLLGSADDIFNMMTNIAPLGIFKGINANLTPAETEMLQKAYALEQQGMGREAIRQATSPPGGSGGWFRAPWDQKWRMEVDDSKSLVNASGPEGARVSNDIPLGVDPSLDIGPGGLLEHPELFSAYDKNALAAHTYISPSRTILGSDRGSYSPADRSVTYFAPQTAEQARSTALHEVGGHGVQDIEGFARGGNPAAMATDTSILKKPIDAMNDFLAQRGAPLNDLPTVPGIQAMGAPASEIPFMYQQRYFTKFVKDSDLPEFEKLLDDVSKASEGYIDPFKLYLRQGGEAEARLIQARRDLTPAQRAALDPIEQMDTMLKQEGILGGLDDLIVRYGDGPAMSQVMPERFDAWRKSIWDDVMQGRFHPEEKVPMNADILSGKASPSRLFRAMSDAEMEAGKKSGAFKPLRSGDPDLYVTPDPDRLAGGAYGAKGGGYIVEFDPVDVHKATGRLIDVDEIAAKEIPYDKVRKIWKWNPEEKDHVLTWERGANKVGGIADELPAWAPADRMAQWQMSPQQFEQYASAGKLHQATGNAIPGEETARTPLKMGELNAYPDQDIAHFYWARRGKTQYGWEEMMRDAIKEGKAVPYELVKAYRNLADLWRKTNKAP